MRNADAGDHRLRPWPRRRDGPAARVASPELELVAVTTVAGNQTLDKVTANAIRVARCRQADAHPGRGRGADRPLDPPRRAWPARCTARPGSTGPDLPPPSREPGAAPRRRADGARSCASARSRSIAIGPLTNIALLLAHAPGARRRRSSGIVLMGGAIGLGQRHAQRPSSTSGPIPEAADRVFDVRPDVTMVGLDVTHRAHALGRARRGAARARAAPAPWSPTCTRFYRRFHRAGLRPQRHAVHDALAVAHVIQPEIIATEHLHVEIDVTQAPAAAARSSTSSRRTDRRQRTRTSSSDVDADRLHRPADRPDRSLP